MNWNFRIHRLRIGSLNKRWFAIPLGGIIVATTLTAFPAVSTTLFSLVTCASAAPCDGGSNSGTGPGAQGDSTKGNGVVGNTKSVTGNAGVAGNDTSTKTTTNVGVRGLSSLGNGVYGASVSSSSRGSGVKGYSPSATGVGVYGLSTTSKSTGIAIDAVSVGGRGIVSTVKGPDINSACGQPAILAVSAAASAVLADSSGDPCIGVAYPGASVGETVSGELYGVLANATQTSKGAPGIAVEGDGDQGGRFVATGSCPVTSCLVPPNALEVAQNGAGLVIYATGTSGFLSLDDSGNLRISGTLTQHAASARSNADAPLNRPILASNPDAATVESVGEGRLKFGQSYVVIDASLAKRIDFSQAYQVVVTPEGPSNGVYITEKSSRGFAVRENPGGHSTIAFGYRLVATAKTSAQPQKFQRLDTHNEDRILARLKATAQRDRTRAIPK